MPNEETQKQPKTDAPRVADKSFESDSDASEIIIAIYMAI